MTKQLKVALTLFLFTLLTSNVALAETLKTNISGIVLKKVNCYTGNLSVTLVNRTNQSLMKKYLKLTVFDEDNDPIGNCSINIRVGPKSGDRLHLSGCNCSGNTTISAQIQ